MMPQSRAATSSSFDATAHLTTWTLNAAALDAFTTANTSSPAATYTWWAAARTLTAALDAWYTLNTASANTMDKTNVANVI
jgi:hypothetical protein